MKTKIETTKAHAPFSSPHVCHCGPPLLFLVLLTGFFSGTTTAQMLTTEVLYSFTNGPAYPRAHLVQGPDGNFYGTTSGAGSDSGTVFKVNTNGALTLLVSFNGANGANPQAGLTLGSDGNFYGTTSEGGSSGLGTVVQVTTNGVLTSLVSFNGASGANPQAGLTLGSDGSFYGTTYHGGSSDRGTVFKVTTNGVLTSLVSFNATNGANPQASLTLGRDGNFYGTTYGGGSGVAEPFFNDLGTVFKVTPNGLLTSLVSFNVTNGANPQAGLTLGSDGNFYGTTYSGGNRGPYFSGWGTVFKVTPNGVLTSLVSFTGANAFPQAALTLGSNGNFYGTTYAGGSIGSSGFGSGTVFQVTTNGVLTSLVSFNDTNGASPQADLTLGSDGNFYGTTVNGGSSGYGTVFKVSANGVLNSLVSFTGGANGANPAAGLTLGSDGNFYGTTYYGGSGGLDAGTVFKMTTNGVLTLLVSFTGGGYGANPAAGLALASDGNFYGTTYGGGDCCDAGTVFKMTTNGVLTTFVSFNGENGAFPRGDLTLGNDGNLYGTTYRGGSNSVGTVFQVATNGELTSLASFNWHNGAAPYAGVTLGSDGNLYGTTLWGPFYRGNVFKMTTNGVLTSLVSFDYVTGMSPSAGLTLGNDGNFYGTTREGVFKVTPNGVLTTLVSFAGVDGANPQAALTLGSDGNFYGTTREGGRSDYGTVFKVTPNGVLTSLVSFDYANGAYPQASLTLGSDGNFYGTTYSGGSGGGGVIFRLNLAPTLSHSQLAITANSSNVNVTLAAAAGSSWHLERAFQLAGPWTNLGSLLIATNGLAQFQDTNSAFRNVFYRAVLP